ncbi:hypothetical protein ATE84_2940 [Aquimarina sp. MAR_2010_214]|uniref:hypothetical protein n=1 Tax=Aquimarina sp. MAR_2010_214 TaxID=1250026 RepID=UPI000C709506|nr:hypothetical protein [Aquimarina sp. MAR_2010_214]PKV50872.1 hypothetical protein ATE84_2940 [Aquimarina sp. MAR_2010_214]
MGWTSFAYNKARHLDWTAEQALEFCQKEFSTDGYHILRFWFDKATHLTERNAIYLVMKDADGDNFILTVLVDIMEGNIFYKEMDNSMGPIADRCPVAFLEMLPEPTSIYDTEWRKRVIKNRVIYHSQIAEIISPLNI